MDGSAPSSGLPFTHKGSGERAARVLSVTTLQANSRCFEPNLKIIDEN
jgi:hypothetical protein